MRGATWLVGVVLLAVGLSSTGCVSAEQHRATLADLQRLRTEAWQRGVEAAALRVALDRAAAENAALRMPQPQPPPSPEIQALSAKLDDVARRQDAMADDIRAAATCGQAQPAAAGAPAAAGQAAAPKQRKVTDLLYSRF